MKIEKISELVEKFKKMPLAKQSVIAVATITLIITALANYKNLKEASKNVINNITNDENIKEFLSDVNRLVTSLGELVHKFFKDDKIDGEQGTVDLVETQEGEE